MTAEPYRRPMTKARSEWVEVDNPVNATLGTTCWHRRVGDGLLAVLVGETPWGWHLSISFRDHRGRLSRYPRWDEIAEARYRFCPADVTMCMVLPPPEEYLSVHDTTFQLHQHHRVEPGP
jgi:hypothetical protein